MTAGIIRNLCKAAVMLINLWLHDEPTLKLRATQFQAGLMILTKTQAIDAFRPPTSLTMRRSLVESQVTTL